MECERETGRRGNDKGQTSDEDRRQVKHVGLARVWLPRLSAVDRTGMCRIQQQAAVGAVCYHNKEANRLSLGLGIAWELWFPAGGFELED